MRMIPIPILGLGSPSIGRGYGWRLRGPYQGGELDQLQMMTMRVPRNQPTALLLQP